MTCRFSLRLAALLMLALAGCVQAPPPPPPSPEALASTAAAAADARDFARAAALYAEAAAASAAPERSHLLILAAVAAARGGERARAEELLAQVNASNLDAAGQARLQLARTRIELSGLAPLQALERIPPPNLGTPSAVAAATQALRAELLFAAGRTVAGVHALVQREVWLLEPAAVRANDYLIWDTLRGIANPNANRDALAAADRITRGWVELAVIGEQPWTSSADLKAALAAWEQRYPGHPAARHILPERFGYEPSMAVLAGPGGVGAQVVGLALPLSGEFAGAAGAIADGFLAGYYNQRPPRASLRVYDSGEFADVQALLDAARADGVGVLAGPLNKERVNALARLPHIPLPVLALNYSDTGGRFPGFYQFGLAPEDEARAAARYASAQGWGAAIALVPQGEWGYRILQAFRDAMTANGGTLLDYATFVPSRSDHAEPIKQVLRYHGVNPESAGQVPAGGEPVERGRRQDADFIFIAAQPQQARLIRTQLRFFRATQLPVLATSHVYSGNPNPALDQDLNGIVFADMPWVLGTGQRQRFARTWPASVQAYPRLFAMGLDAWRLIEALRAGRLQPGELFAGATGQLVLQPDGQIRRRLDWARFESGRPVPIIELRSPRLVPVANEPREGPRVRP